MKKILLLLLVFVLLGSALRLYMLNSRPDGFTWDEAALGYNSYSLLLTGRDEYGKIMPIILKSFADYKPGLYTYFLVPLTAIGGLNQFTTRLPSAIFGVLGIIVVFLLGEKMYGKKVGLAAGFIMAINPWSIQFSRGTWEANVCLIITTLATLLFIQKKYFWSVVFFGLTFWTYQGAKLFTPLLVISLMLIYRQTINFSALIKRSVIAIIFLLPIVLGWASQSGRLKVYSVFSYHRSLTDVQAILAQDHSTTLNLDYYLFHSEILDQFRGIYLRYLNNISLRFLFITGDWTSLRQTIPYFGYFYVVDLVTLALGLIWVARHVNSHSILTLAWLFLAPIPAALSRDQVSGVRTLPLLLPLVLICSLGLVTILQRKYLRLAYFAILGFLMVYYCDLYFIHATYFSAKDWLYPYRNAVQLVGKNMGDYKTVVFTTDLGQPYIFLLYYLKLDPRSYQTNNHLVEDSQGDVGQVNNFGKFEFRRINWPVDRLSQSTLFVGTALELPEQDLPTVKNLTQIGDIDYPDGQAALRIVGIP